MSLRFIFSLILFCGCIATGCALYFFESNWLDLSTINQQVKPQASVILDDEGRELARFELDRRDPVTIDKIPDVVVKAFIAAEDHQFFSHVGFSFKGVVRSLLINLYHRRAVQGASTITQQVARLLFLSNERTYWRKIKELFVALQLERQLSKDQILELYLNNMYFGRGIYGVQAACKRFWNKSVTDVVLDEAAMLAAVAKSARFYSPLNAPLTAQRRRNIVLRSMFNLGFMAEHEYQAARDKPLKIEDHLPGNPMRLYIQEWIRAWAERQWGKEVLYSKGLKIQSTINQFMQQKAEQSFARIVNPMRVEMGDSLNGGMVSLQTATGKIKTVIGGIDFCKSQFNRAFQAYRQLGSSFKPILYSLALNSGFDMDEILVDEPFEMTMADGQVWTPRNWTHNFDGPMTLLRALTYSNNIIAIKMLLKLGADKLVPWAQRFGITRDLLPYPSLALGTVHGSVEENAAAFNVFANNGMYVEPYVVEWVKDEWGKKIWQHREVKRRVLDTKINSKMVKALSLRMEISKQRAKDGWLDSESIGKTGSTNGAASTWFVGATPEHTTAVYLGRDDNKPMGRFVYASATAFPIWLNFAKHISCQKKHFYLDPELKEVAINWVTGQRVSKRDDNAMMILKEA